MSFFHFSILVIYSDTLLKFKFHKDLCHCGVVVVSTAQLQSVKPELRLCGGSNPACSVLEISDGEDL